MNTLRTRWLARVAVLFASASFVAIVTAGCGHTYHESACVEWPAEDECPSDDVVVLYLGDELEGCGAELVSVDAPGRHHEKRGCCYPVTVYESDGCQPLL
jgi:hypothetical protein